MIQYRVLVFQWMMEVCEYFNLDPTTTHGAMAYLDRLQPNEKFSRFEWQMLAICCILIAGKYNESEEDLPDLATLEDITQQRIANETVLSYELWALKRMGWKLSVRTPMSFLSCFLSLGVTTDEDFDIKRCSTSVRDEINSVLVKQIHAFITTITLDHSFKKYTGSILAAAVLYSSRSKLDFSSVWPQRMVMMTGYDAKSLVEVVQAIESAYAISSAVNSSSKVVTSPSSSAAADDDANKENKIHIVEGEVHVKTDNKEKVVARASPTSISNVDEYEVAQNKIRSDEEDHMLRILASTSVTAE